MSFHPSAEPIAQQIDARIAAAKAKLHQPFYAKDSHELPVEVVPYYGNEGIAMFIITGEGEPAVLITKQQAKDFFGL